MRVISTFILTLLISCKGEVKTENTIPKNFEKKIIYLVNSEIYLPREYANVSIEEFEKKLSSATENKNIEIVIGSIERLKALESYINLYVDQNNAENCLLFQKGEYISLNKKIASQYSSMLSSSAENNWKSIGINYELVENKFIDIEKIKIIKIKFLQVINDNKRYITQYLVSGNGKTFSIVVANQKNVDFETELTKMKIN